jgi:cell division protein FtsB
VDLVGLDFLVPVFGILLVLVPVTGVTVVFTLRYGGKPFVETLARELRGHGALQPPDQARRIEQLTEQVEALTAEVEQLRDAQRFDERLLGSP